MHGETSWEEQSTRPRFDNHDVVHRPELHIPASLGLDAYLVFYPYSLFRFAFSFTVIGESYVGAFIKKGDQREQITSGRWISPFRPGALINQP